MKKKKNTIIIVLSIALAVVVICSCTIYFLLKDKLMLRSRINEIVNSDYTYVVDFSIKGFDIPLSEKHFKAQITGFKSDKAVYGQVDNDIVNGMEVFLCDENGDTQVMFNVKPVIENAIEEIGSISGVSLISKLIPKGEMYVSLNQIEEITGTRLVSIKDAGVDMTFFEKLAKGIDMAMKIQVTDSVTSSQRFVGNDARYFEIYLEDYDTDVVIGIPRDKEDKRISLMATHDDISWMFIGTYETGHVEAVDIPDATLDESQVKTLKTIYDKIIEIKNFLN